MITDHFLEEFLKRNGFDEEIIQHIKPYNVKKQIEKVNQLSMNEIQIINDALLKIKNKEYIFPLFYSLICKISIEKIANYMNFSSNRKPKKNKHIYYCNHETMENAINSLIREFNIDSIILIIESIDEEICNTKYIRYNKDVFKINKISNETFRNVKMYIYLTIQHMEENIQKLYSLNSLIDEKIRISKTSIAKVIIQEPNTKIMDYILAKLETIKQISWKRFLSVDFTKFTGSELDVIMKYLTVENFHHLLNYDGDFHKLLFYLMMNNDDLANPAIKYLPSLIENIKPVDNDFFIYQLEDEIFNFVRLYKLSKPFNFLLKPYSFYTKDILTELLLREYPCELVMNKDFIKRLENFSNKTTHSSNRKHLIINCIYESIQNNLNIFLYGDTYEKISQMKNILEKNYELDDQNIKIIKELIGRYLKLEKDKKVKKELLAYLITTKTEERKTILYPIVIDLMNNINKKSKSLFYLAFEKNIGCSLIETRMINEFKQFLSF
ncbi:MAG: hypothetical protein N2505_00035 [Endomicrobia bacterium]|nr:hypothetical protein [Endomicrobiia bacterium]